MNGARTFEDLLRDVVRGVVREELHAALQAQARRNAPGEADDEGEGYMSLAQAARLAAVAPGTIRRWIRERRLKASRAGRVFRIRRRELERFLAAPAESVIREAQAFLSDAA